MGEINTFNKFFVGVQGSEVVTMKPIPQKLNSFDAKLLAAYLASMAEVVQPNGEESFDKIKEAVENT